MTDIMDEAARSRLMSRIRSTNTRPELALRKGLFALGYRYQLYRRDLPGKPDLVLPRHRAAIFVHGCFWHGHDCHLFQQPGTREEFWKDKIADNRERDARNRETLLATGWRVLEVWECAMRGPYRRPLDEVVESASMWLQGCETTGTLRGTGAEFTD